MKNATTLAKTWNANESGVLWECLWMFSREKGYYSFSYGPGFDNPVQPYPNEKSFWEAFRKDKRQFYGEVKEPTHGELHS